MTASLVALAMGAWAAEAAVPLPPECSAADTQRRAILFSGGWGTDDKPGYSRYCGPGRAVVRVGGKSFTLKGGRCTSRRAGFGVLWNGIGNAPPGRGFWFLLERANRPGRNDIIDGGVELPGVTPAHTTGRGTAIVAKSLKSATFSLKGPSQTKITGSWTCG